MLNCSDVRLPGNPEVLGADGAGKVYARWEADPDSDYEISRPFDLL